jgi:hypothetical protein
MFAFVAFFVVIGETVGTVGLAPAYLLAVLVTLPLGAVVAAVDRRLARY